MWVDVGCSEMGLDLKFLVLCGRCQLPPRKLFAFGVLSVLYVYYNVLDRGPVF